MKAPNKMTRKKLYWSRRATFGLFSGFIGSLIIGSCTRSRSIGEVTPASSDKTRSPKPKDSEDLSTLDLPDSITAILQDHQDPDAVFTALMPAVVDILQCDRCFLFIRDPQRQRTRITHGYSRKSRWPTMVQSDWSQESPDLNANDPLTLSAYESPEAHFIEDIETASQGTLDINLERSVFGHRALVHAPIYHDEELYGVLEPCVFETPRQWTEGDRTFIHRLQQVLGTWVFRYLQQAA